jgi:transketolase
LPIAVEAARRLEGLGVPVRVVSLPSWEAFKRQHQSYRDQVLPPALRARVSIEAATRFGWLEWVTEDGEMIGIEHFGASAPAERLYQEFGITPDAAVAAVQRVLAGRPT